MYLVTGGAGLIGSSMVALLNAHGINDILIVDHLGNSDKWKNLAALKYNDYMEKAEFRQKLQSRYFDKFDGVIHLGACSSTTERDASYLVDNNFRYTAELADFCIGRKIRFVYASSCATYGNGDMGYDDDENIIPSLRPLNMYGYSKQMFDLFALRCGWFKSITGCKFSNVYGPNEEHKAGMRSVVLRAYEQITSSGKLQLFKSYRQEYADGEQLRDFLYVKDAVAMVEYLFNRSDAGGIYNIGSGLAESWNLLAQGAFAALNKPVNIEYIDMPESLRDRYQYYTCAKMDKLHTLGWNKKSMSLADAIKDYYVNYLIPGKRPGDEVTK